MRKVKCPRCGSKNTVPIMYGLPNFDDKLQKDLKAKKYVLGGCCISDTSPHVQCLDCDFDFASKPIIHSEYGIEDYRQIVTSISFSDGGFFEGYTGVELLHEDDQYKAYLYPPYSRRSVEASINESTWNKLLESLFCNCYLHEWEHEFVDPDVMDGEQWELELKLTHNREIHYDGDNAYPPYWHEFIKLFRPYINQAKSKAGKEDISTSDEKADDKDSFFEILKTYKKINSNKE